MSAVTRLSGRVSIKIFNVESIMSLCAKFHTFVPICAIVKLTALTIMKLLLEDIENVVI